MDTNFTTLLATALQRASDAHDAYQAEVGPYPDWAEWYAERMTRALAENRSELEEILREVLRNAGAAHGTYEAEVLGGVRDEEWPRWYAEHMTRALGADAQRLEPGITAFLAE